MGAVADAEGLAEDDRAGGPANRGAVCSRVRPAHRVPRESRDRLQRSLAAEGPRGKLLYRFQVQFKRFREFVENL